MNTAHLSNEEMYLRLRDYKDIVVHGRRSIYRQLKASCKSTKIFQMKVLTIDSNYKQCGLKLWLI